MSDVTRLLSAAGHGDLKAAEELLPFVYQELRQLAEDKVKAELVKLRYFAGLTIEEAAQVLGISEPTAKRYWTFARAWLYREIQSDAGKGRA